MWILCNLPPSSLLKTLYLTSQNFSLWGYIIWLLQGNLFDASGCTQKPDSCKKAQSNSIKHKSQGFLWHINRNYNTSREKFTSLFVSQAVQTTAAFNKLPLLGITLSHFGLSLESSAIRSVDRSVWFRRRGSSSTRLPCRISQSALQNKPSPDCLSFWTPQTGYAKAVQPPHLIGEVQQLSLAQNKEKETNKVTTNK